MDLSCEFQKKHSFEKRVEESKRILNKYPDKIPIIVSKEGKSKLTKIDKCKYLAPNDLTLGQFAMIIRKRIELKESEALFFFTEKSSIPTTSASLTELYNLHKNEDGFLYIFYCGENVFG